MRYVRPSDYALGALTATFAPALMLLWERVAPSRVGRGGFAPIMRLTGAIGAGAGFLFIYQRSTRELYRPITTRGPNPPMPTHDPRSSKQHH